MREYLPIIAIISLAFLFIALRWAKSHLNKGSEVAGAISWIVLVIFAVLMIANIR